MVQESVQQLVAKEERRARRMPGCAAILHLSGKFWTQARRPNGKHAAVTLAWFNFKQLLREALPKSSRRRLAESLVPHFLVKIKLQVIGQKQRFEYRR